MPRKIRVLVGKPGLDGHDRGAKVVAAALRDAGMEVIYTGLHQTPEQIVEAAIQEDVDVVALSVLSGAHMTLFPEVLELMRARGIGDRLLSGGGIIPAEDMETLATRGVGRLFGPGSSTQDIAVYIRDWFRERTGEEPYVAPPLPAPSAMPSDAWAGGATASGHHPTPSAAPAAVARATAKRATPTHKPSRAKRAVTRKPKPKRAAAKRAATKRAATKPRRAKPARNPAKRAKPAARRKVKRRGR